MVQDSCSHAGVTLAPPRPSTKGPAPGASAVSLAAAADQRLAELAGEGDRAGFEQIVLRHRPAMLAHARRILDADAAEDAVQLASISAWRALGDGCEVTHLRAWLLAIVHRSALQSIRTRAASTESLTAELPAADTPADTIERRMRTRATLAALADLPPRERDALLLEVVQGRSGRDTARELGVSEGVVRQLVFRARSRMRASLAAPLACPPAAWLLSLWRRRCARGGARAAHAGAHPLGAGLPVLGRAAAVVVAGAAVAAPVAIHVAGAPRARVAHAHATPSQLAPATGAAARVAPTSAARNAHPSVATSALDGDTRRGGAVPAGLARGLGTGSGVASTPEGASAGPGTRSARSTTSSAGSSRGEGPSGGRGAGAGGGSSPGGAVIGSPVAGPGGGNGSGASGGPVAGAGAGAGGAVQGVAQAAGGAVSGVTHTAEAVVGQVTGTISSAAPVVGTTVQGAGTTVTQTVNKTGEAVQGVLEHVGTPPAPGAPPLGGLVGR
jgi:RNA polymerase sigma-70 factor (ECF subfamily)